MYNFLKLMDLLDINFIMKYVHVMVYYKYLLQLWNIDSINYIYWFNKLIPVDENSIINLTYIYSGNKESKNIIKKIFEMYPDDYYNIMNALFSKGWIDSFNTYKIENFDYNKLLKPSSIPQRDDLIYFIKTNKKYFDEEFWQLFLIKINDFDYEIYNYISNIKFN